MTAPHPHRASITLGAALLGCLLASCSSSPASPASSATPTGAATASTATSASLSAGAALTDWYTEGVENLVTTMQSDFGQIGTDTGASNFTALHADCTKLGTDVRTAQAYRPAPDGAAQTSWANALHQFAAGATDCTAGASAQDPSRILTATTEITTGSTDLSTMSTRIATLGSSD